MFVTILLGSVLLGACNDQPPKQTVFDAQVKALEKARKVQDTVNEGAARERERVEQQDGTSAPSN
jgi:hypothetical protein